MKEKKILIIKFGGLGDILMSLTAMFSIYKFHKQRVILLTEQPYDKFLGESNWFEEIITIKRSIFYVLDKINIKKKNRSFIIKICL